jgi:hypothetical protein
MMRGITFSTPKDQSSPELGDFQPVARPQQARRRAEHTILAQGAVPSREAPLNDLPGLYQEFGLMLAISRMEVRRRMVSVVHGDDNTEETG